MSGKPASVAASRAGAPRVLVYVAERQLEGGAGPGPAAEPPPAATLPHYLPADHQPTHSRSLYRHHLESDPRNSLGNLYYKSVNESDGGQISAYGTSDGTIVHRANFLPTGQHFLKEPCTKVLEEAKASEHLNSEKREHIIRSGVEFGTRENYRVPIESSEITTYQTRCQTLGPDNVMPPMQAVSIRQNYNQFTNCAVQNGDSICDREQSVTKNFVSYQFVEHSVSHQSVVNQSISILGERGCGRSEESVGGVVLAVLPPHDIDPTSARTLQETPQTITVPLGWKRIINGTSVLYISPSGTALSTLPQLREYLQTTGTCKCGLPCPLRPETAFSFDPKVASKPYQPASGAELTKLCNHKRKLLATLQARAHSPGTPPPQLTDQKKVCAEVGVLKKKMKKRAGPPNVNVSQLVVQRELPFNEFKPQESDFRRTISPGINMRQGAGQGMPTFSSMQHIPHSAQDDSPVQKGAHYLTVHSGLITQHENIDSLQKVPQPSASVNNAINIGLPVLGTNGQIIGVNTGFNKNTSFKNNMNVMTQNIVEQQKDERKETMQQPVQTNKQPNKDDESQIFCGLNQPLTPEVMQKINEQQQIFIQQNQKQIEMAMKGFRTQLAENLNQNKPQNQNQFIPQGQLVIQNGAVVKASPAKTPPWQVKRNDSNSNALMSSSPKHQKLDGGDYEESTSVSEDSSGSYSPYPNNDQAMCSRVPPLPQHYNIVGQQWPGVDANKRKAKTPNKGGRKKALPVENKIMTFGNNGIRILQDPKGSMGEEIPNNSVPSFMDDPSGYLAQQTVLLNNTISRQVGINSSFENNHFENSNNCYTPQNQGDKIGKAIGKQFDGPNMYRGSMVPNPSPSPNHTPDSSVVSDKNMENAFFQCCKGCNASMKNNVELSENQLRLKYMKQNVFKLDFDGNAATSSPRHGFEDNPVTSSTFMERNPVSNDNCGPIQAGTVSTSNVSPSDTMQQPEPSPTLSNSSRSTDTPQSNGTNNSLIQTNNCSFPMPSPAYSNPGSSRDNFNSNPSTPGCGQTYQYNSPGPSCSQSVTGTQMMNFISNHNVNKNLMEVDNISMVGVKPVMKSHEICRTDIRRKMENSMPGYCPPPHLGSGPAQSLIQACYVQTFVTTMASGFSVTRNTVTSVLAGKANTATTSINASQANFIRPPPPPSVNLATTYAIPNNQPDPFINSVNIPTSYPLHIAGTTAQNMISKTPIEMVHNIGSVPSKPESSNVQANTISISGKRTATPGQILISSTGQIMVSNNTMPPPPPKTTIAVSSLHTSNATTTVNTSVSQVVPAVGGVQPIVNQSTVVVNTLPAPFVIQPSMMAVDGQVVQQNAVLPQIVAGVVPGHQGAENTRQIDIKNGQGFLQGVAMLSPESIKKRSKKKKVHNTTNITNVLQITAPQQNPSNIMVHSSPQHNTSPQFSPRGFQLSPNNNISPTAPMLQALTIVPGKSGTPAHIVMNGQGNTNNFGSQQIITNTSPSQQINLLQPVNLINNASGVVSNFPTFQQFIVPNLGGMVMTTDGTTIIQDNSTGMPMQLQLQTVNGQNVLTPVQNPGVFTASANGGVVLRAQNQQSKIIQSQHSPSAQFLSPNNQVVMNSPNFNGQLSPLLANLSPTNVTFNANSQVRQNNVQAQEFIQTNQMGQTMMVPLSPKQVSIASAGGNRGNSTFVQQNTTIVQQQTTLVSNSHNAQMSSITSNMQANQARLSIDPNVLLKQGPNQKNRFVEMSPESVEMKEEKVIGLKQEIKVEGGEDYAKLMSSLGMSGEVRHSVSTQTLGKGRGKSPPAGAAGASPPDTTTLSPLGALDPAPSPSLYAPRCLSTQAHYADTTTESPEPADGNSSGMVQCVSSSEQDMAESREMAWRTPRNDFAPENDAQNMLHNMPMVRQNRTPSSAEPPEMLYNHSQNMNASPMNNQHLMPVSSNYYDRPHSYKRKNDYGDGSSYRTDKIMRTNNGMVHGMPKDSHYDSMGMSTQDKMQTRHYQSGSSGDNSNASMMQRVFERHNLGSGDDVKSEDESDAKSTPEASGGRNGRFEVGELVWGPVKGYASWPGKVVAREEDRASVRWFGGDRAPTTMDVAKLLTLDEGLEAHHAASTRHRKSRKLNTLLENAIQEAMAELDKKSENTSERIEESASGEDGGGDPAITETPRRTKKFERPRKDKQHKKNPLTSTKTSETRLRSSR